MPTRRIEIVTRTARQTPISLRKGKQPTQLVTQFAQSVHGLQSSQHTHIVGVSMATPHGAEKLRLRTATIPPAGFQVQEAGEGAETPHRPTFRRDPRLKWLASWTLPQCARFGGRRFKWRTWSLGPFLPSSGSPRRWGLELSWNLAEAWPLLAWLGAGCCRMHASLVAAGMLQLCGAAHGSWTPPILPL